MSIIQKRNKISINLKSSGTFLNLKKPKLLSIDKSQKNNIKIIKQKNINHNISNDISPFETITRFTENNSKDSKDEIIRVLKERLTVLEKKVKILEKENNENISKISKLNLSHDSSKKENSFNTGLKLNLKLVRKKNKSNILKILNISKSLNKENSITKKNNNRIMNLNNNINSINNNHQNHFLSIFNINNNNITNKRNICNSEYKYKTKQYIIIPRKKLFDNVLKKSLIKYSSIDNNKLNYNKIKKDFNKNIPIPRKKKQHRSIIINNIMNNYKLRDLTNSPENKKISNSEKKYDFSLINNSEDTNEKNKVNEFKITNSNESKFNTIKNRLENIKIRTKNLLEYYSTNNFNTINIENNKGYNKYHLNNIINNNE